MKKVAILGIRGIPANHGGFETFAEKLALYLVSREWQVTVYCQDDGGGSAIHESWWKKIHLIHLPSRLPGALGTIEFDLKSALHAAKEGTLILTLGYNTAAFCSLYRLKGIPNLINMDGLEWKRDKWNSVERTWLYINERLGCWLGNHLIADHPEIKQHLTSRISSEKITMIPYGAEHVQQASENLLEPYGLHPGAYALIIARPEPENSILEIVKAFSAKRRGISLAVLGKYDPSNSYHRKVIEAASDEVSFIGAIYEEPIVQALRSHSRLYIHGHRVGGTNPSLVEALGAGSAVLAHDNAFNRWVAGPENQYFNDVADCERKLDIILDDPIILNQMKAGSMQRYHEEFRWSRVLEQYERLLEAWLPNTMPPIEAPTPMPDIAQAR